MAVDNGKVPWPKLREYLLRVSSCQTPQEFLHTACLEVQTLIPFDVTAGIFDTSDARYLEGVGQSDAVNASYDNYYRTRQPYFLGRAGKHVDWDVVLATQVFDWRKFCGLEFAMDFMLPSKMVKSLTFGVLGQKITLSIHRSLLSPDFLDSDIGTLGLVNESLNNLYSSFDKRKDIPDSTFSAEGIAERFPPLSSREAEICSLVTRRLNTPEIATYLFISRRTVEKHIESIFEKLDVRSREQLRWRLGVTPPTGIWQRQ